MCDVTHISSSPLGSASYSKQVAEDVIRDLREKDPDASSTVHDVSLPHIDDDFVAATSLELNSYPQATNGRPPRGLWDGVHSHSAWRKLVDAVLEPRTLTDENEIIEYLHRHRHDLPPVVWI
jgi:hypothetical protein